MQLKAFTTTLLLLVALPFSVIRASVIRSPDYDTDAFQPGYAAYDNEVGMEPPSRHDQHHQVVGYDDGHVNDMGQRARDERQRGRQQGVSCPGCVRQEVEEQLSAEALRQLRVEMIKQQILENLRMEAPPNITAPRPVIPAPLLATMDRHTDYDAEQEALEEARTKTTEVATFATNVNNCMGDRPSACLTFSLKDALSPDEVHTAELWVYKLPDPLGSPYRNQSFIASALNDEDGETTRERVDIELTAAKRGWIKFNVRHLVKRWLHHPEADHQVEVSCRDCFFDNDEVPIATKDELKPFIVTYTTDMRRRRSKRAVIDCSPSTTTCCRERLYIDFTEIGWGWIAQPEGYWANFCRGSCNGGIMLPTKQHTTIMQILRLVDPPNRATMCCAPSRLSALSILYYEQQDDQNTIIRREDMADMVVESCGCI